MNSEGDTWTPGHMGPRVPSLGQDLDNYKYGYNELFKWNKLYIKEENISLGWWAIMPILKYVYEYFLVTLENPVIDC